jgi:hypothetical protein
MSAMIATGQATLKRRVLSVAALIALTVLSPAVGRAQKAGPWQGWMTTNDPRVQWQYRTIDWGKSMSADCDLQFRIEGEGAANFHWYVTYTNGEPGSSEIKQRDNPAYNVTRDQDFNAFIGGCRVVRTARVDRVTRRGAGGGSGAGGLKPIEGDDRKVDGGGPPKRGGPSTGSLKPPPGVIVFPGPWRAPSLGAVSMDSASLRFFHDQSTRLNQKLLGWRPMREWAGHGTPVLQQADWDALAKLLARVGKPTLRSLAAESSQHAAIYPSNSTLGRFWKTLASFYQHQSEL